MEGPSPGQGSRYRIRFSMAIRRALDLLSRPRRQLPRVRRAEDLGARLMRLLHRGDTLVIASHTPGKIREIDDLLRSYGVAPVAAGDLNISEPEESEITFAGN